MVESHVIWRQSQTVPFFKEAPKGLGTFTKGAELIAVCLLSLLQSLLSGALTHTEPLAHVSRPKPLVREQGPRRY